MSLSFLREWLFSFGQFAGYDLEADLSASLKALSLEPSNHLPLTVNHRTLTSAGNRLLLFFTRVLLGLGRVGAETLVHSPEQHASPLFIVAESYGGKFAVTLELSAFKAIQDKKLKLVLGGVALGDSWISPEDFVLSWGHLLNEIMLNYDEIMLLQIVQRV
ncbi:hypothetical protein RIF29_00154 [Crotalaria pallida]|uniref:Carboxypeptidase n=1 Tax=Crotalaria pallida TaxID=3830 RepID=A0AAN9IVK5_CROPI